MIIHLALVNVQLINFIGYYLLVFDTINKLLKMFTWKKKKKYLKIYGVCLIRTTKLH